MGMGKLWSALGAIALAVGLMAPGAADEPTRKAASLKMVINGGYDSYVGGQGITLTGQLPKAGVRKIWLERHMNRPGDAWTKVEDLPYRGTTRADGSFEMPIHAPDMVGLSYRVRGANGGATPGVTFNPRTQDVTMTVLDPLNLGALVVVADVTPDHVFGRPDLFDVPLFVGRELTLQERTSPTEWRDISTTLAGPDGRGVFLPFVETAGEHVYRVRMEDWTRNGSDIGWQASFPTYVEVGGILDRARPAAPSSAAPAAPLVEPRSEVTGTAAQKYQWYPVLFGFDWEEGQDLDSPPKNGAPKGRWIQYTDGAGRAGKHNGQLRLDSGRRLTRFSEGDFGTTRATLAGNADAYGRWETRLRIKTFETGSKDYDIVLELVPEKASDYQCGRQNITIARYDGNAAQMSFGVNAGTSRWTKTVKAPSLANSIPAFAVEVAKDHIAWFVNGQAVGVVRSKAAVSDVPMTMRFSLVGDQSEHKNTAAYSDWQRHFGIGEGTQVKKGPALKKSALTGCVDRR